MWTASLGYQLGSRAGSCCRMRGLEEGEARTSAAMAGALTSAAGTRSPMSYFQTLSEMFLENESIQVCTHTHEIKFQYEL